MSALEKLLSVSSDAFLDSAAGATCLGISRCAAARDLQFMLTRKNGFVAFESALLVRPAHDTDTVLGLDSWNLAEGWRRWYRDRVPEDALFFAEDLFGGQFGVCGAGIIKLDPETGETSTYASDLENWAAKLLKDYAEDTGWPLAHEWQLTNPPIHPSQRLIPRQPFVLGGDFAVENLVLVAGQRAMEKWGRLYHAIRAIPDGQQATIPGWLDFDDDRNDRRPT